MASSSDRDDVRCRHYAKFASHLNRAHFDIIYWLLFALVIFMLFAASWRYGRSVDAVEKYAPGAPQHRRMMKQCMLVCAMYAIVSIVAVVMEVFVLMALQFCDGEDLMALYWSTWTVMQIGSLIAIFGILLAVFHTIQGRKHPPWALALGTPVLVVAGLGHIIQAAMHKRVKSVRARSISFNARRPRADSAAAMSTSDTIRAEDESEKEESEYNYKAKLLGHTPGGSPILQFCQSSSPPSPLLDPTVQSRIIGTNMNGQVIVAFRKSTVATGMTAIPVNKGLDSPMPPEPVSRRPTRPASGRRPVLSPLSVKTSGAPSRSSVTIAGRAPYSASSPITPPPFALGA